MASRVADIGPGAGWFTMQLARRVGPNGHVYAEDVQRQMLEAIRRRVSREGLQNVEPRLGTETDPNLPPGALDAALMVDMYPGDRRARHLPAQPLPRPEAERPHRRRQLQAGSGRTRSRFELPTKACRVDSSRGGGRRARRRPARAYRARTSLSVLIVLGR